MERFLLDLDHLPRNKKDALRFFMDTLASTTTDKSNLVCGLIFLGFRTLKGKSLTNMPMNIPASTSDNFKVKINFTDAALSTYLSYFEAKKSKRNCVLALLYTGICSFEEYSLFIQKNIGKNPKKIVTLEQVEEDIYLSGLTHFFESYNSDYIVAFNKPQKKSNNPLVVSPLEPKIEGANKQIAPNQKSDSNLQIANIGADMPFTEHSNVFDGKNSKDAFQTDEEKIIHDVKQNSEPLITHDEKRMNGVDSDSSQVAKRRHNMKVDVG